MKKLILALLLIIISSTSIFSYDHRVSVDIGGLQPQYFYPIMNVEYEQKGLFSLQYIGMKAGIRSHGTYYLYNPYSYDFSLLASYWFTQPQKTTFIIKTAVLLGLEYQLRLKNEAKSAGGLNMNVAFDSWFTFNNIFYIRGFLITKWYTNGFAIGIFPELGFRWENFGIYIRTEPFINVLYDFSNNEFSWDNFFGVAFYF